MTVVANVIFPVFTAPHVLPLLFPLAAFAAVASEFGVMVKRHPGLEVLHVVGITLLANFLSWMAGVGLGLLLPSGLEQKTVDSETGNRVILTQGSNFLTLLVFAFLLAFLLSILVEFGVWRRCKMQESGLFKSVAIAHLFSYCAMLALVALIGLYEG